MSIFRRLFSGRREGDEVHPRSVRLPESFTLEELTDRVFPYTAPNDRVTEIADNSPLHPAVTARATFLANHLPATEYLRTLQDAANSCPNEDLPYVWLAELHLIQGKYEEANRWVFEGLNKAREFERLTHLAASAYLKMMNPAAIGWFTQSCILGSFEFTPYLFSARCAKVAGLDDLSRRLLNASDAISPGSRVPDAENQILVSAHKIDRAELIQAMTKFQFIMNDFLPTVDAFPDHPHERDVYIWAHSNDIRHDIRVKLFARPEPWRGKSRQDYRIPKPGDPTSKSLLDDRVQPIASKPRSDPPVSRTLDEKTNNMKETYKECVLCGERFDLSSIQCPKCGRGVFAAARTNPKTDLHLPDISAASPTREYSVFWCCPNCSTILRKPSHADAITELMKEGGPIRGSVRCITCHNAFSPNDVYNGKYDVVKRTDAQGELVYLDVAGKYYVNRSGKHWGKP